MQGRAVLFTALALLKNGKESSPPVHICGPTELPVRV